MERRKILFLNSILILFGAVIAVLWIWLTGGKEFFEGFKTINLFLVTMMVILTSVNLILRFFRWQFLLRRVGIRIPIRSSFFDYFASLVGIATPAYLGEFIRCFIVRRRYGVEARFTAIIVVYERLMDILALALIASISARQNIVILGMIVFSFVAMLAWIFLYYSAPQVKIPKEYFKGLINGKTIIFSFVISIVVWLSASFLLFIAFASLDLYIRPLIGMNIFSLSTLLGGLTLSPAGVGITGSLEILQLQSEQLPFTMTVVAVSLTRLVTTGFAVFLGIAFLCYEVIRLRFNRLLPVEFHFNEIADDYMQQFQPHIWKYLLKKKVDLISEVLSNPSNYQLNGFDLGCGLGEQCLEMEKRGYKVIGTDKSNNLLQFAKKQGAKVLLSDVLAIPIAEQSLSFVYTIGVLHHFQDWNTQREIVSEVERILKPGGVFIVHETNPNNLLFRFYMGYVFPLIRSIDEGTEMWIPVKFWNSINGMELVGIKYFTFIPDFLPNILMGIFKKIEHRLELSKLQRFSVHYMAVLQKPIV